MGIILGNWQKYLKGFREVAELLFSCPPTSLSKQVGGYMRSDNLKLPCIQPPTSSYNLQLPHGRRGHGDHGGHVGHVRQDRTGFL